MRRWLRPPPDPAGHFRKDQAKARRIRWIKIGMIFAGNILPIPGLGGRVIDAEHRSPLFRITLWQEADRHRLVVPGQVRGPSRDGPVLDSGAGVVVGPVDHFGPDGLAEQLEDAAGAGIVIPAVRRVDLQHLGARRCRRHHRRRDRASCKGRAHAPGISRRSRPAASSGRPTPSGGRRSSCRGSSSPRAESLPRSRRPCS